MGPKIRKLLILTKVCGKNRATHATKGASQV